MLDSSTRGLKLCFKTSWPRLGSSKDLMEMLYILITSMGKWRLPQREIRCTNPTLGNPLLPFNYKVDLPSHNHACGSECLKLCSWIWAWMLHRPTVPWRDPQKFAICRTSPRRDWYCRDQATGRQTPCACWLPPGGHKKSQCLWTHPSR